MFEDVTAVVQWAGVAAKAGQSGMVEHAPPFADGQRQAFGFEQPRVNAAGTWRRSRACVRLSAPRHPRCAAPE
jgi:hypothetical protein